MRRNDDPHRATLAYRAGCALALGAEPSVRYDDSGEGVSSVTTYPASMTVAEFEVYPFPDGKVELVRGEPHVMSPAGAAHAKVGSNLLRKLLPFVHQFGLGEVFGDGLGYELPGLPNTVRNPDASFVRASQLPAEGFTRGYLKLAPDLAVEILSPSEAAWELEEKLEDYRLAGTALVWVINPERMTVRVDAAGAPMRWLHLNDTLDGGNVIPGFNCRVSELFEGLAPKPASA